MSVEVAVAVEAAAAAVEGKEEDNVYTSFAYS